jgi:hypothetical protein
MAGHSKEIKEGRPVKEERPEKPESMGHIILQKPLPEILDMIDAGIKESEAAASDARQAAEEARMAGERAAAVVMDKIRRVFLKMAESITQEMEQQDKGR